MSAVVADTNFNSNVDEDYSELGLVSWLAQELNFKLDYFFLT